MSEPKRVQQRRTKGWTKPDGAVSVSRPGKWGNPYTIEEWGLERALLLYRDLCHGTWTPSHAGDDDEICNRAYALGSGFLRRLRQHPLDAIHTDLAGKDLMCFCPLDQPCHADVLLAIANTPKEN